MKSIEERAKEWAYRYPMTPDGCLTESDMRAVATNSYIQGATEQKVIDDAERVNQALMGNGSAINHYNQGFHDAIEMACGYLDNYFMEIGYPDDWLRDSPNIESGKERFIKAMEKQL